ncbi:aminopeptidase N [Thiomicrospira microaerophila]|uniref:aminopeptidase N n=1 Tax=Thiomicrospira microaerophila TaxID=406020 RepID=UPI00200DCBAF|nr:aminopeptidase N [Thiomicrospira microaerophila]UQB41694.1 aminopeptidase N [Thiomicrospira microaerophila]
MTLEAKVNYLSEYQPCDFEVLSVNLLFELSASSTLVTNRMLIKRLASRSVSESENKLKLNGEGLVLKSVRLNGQLLSEAGFQVTQEHLFLSPEGDEFELEVVTEINPQANTALEGLYLSSGNFCTQCEAEGFRRITYFFDRPDVLSVYQTKIIADKQAYPVLLSNGNLIESGELADGRHFAIWHDPFKKPCYLFALIAGDLVSLEDQYFTADNRTIKLCIYTDPHHLPHCRHAMDSLIHAMRWDEQRFGLTYDLDTYMIVAVDDFNMGAMENKGLNIFNSKYVLADPQTATDVDYEGVEAVIAHEYFHNWTGNRVTCRDWFQLTLKEGLTVFRDQEFTADRLSPAVKRIEDVRRLRSHQFAEDAGPMSHPIQPQSYIEMNNFYTLTVYEKGAEVVRLYQTLLGKDGFRKGMDLYFARHDGQAVTVEDFRQAMADANQVDLDQMQAWYVQAGTPHLKVKAEYNAVNASIKIGFQQYLKADNSFSPFLIPFKIGFLNDQGETLYPEVAADYSSAVKLEGQDYVLKISQENQVFEFNGVSDKPQLSLLRGFSAPIIMEYQYSEKQLAFLACHDTDSFNRWESAQRLALMELMANIARFQAQQAYQLGAAYADLFETLVSQALNSDQADLALLAYSLTLPDLNYLIEQYDAVDIEALVSVHQQMKKSLAQKYETLLFEVYQKCLADQAYRYDKQQIAQRLMKNTALSYLSSLATDQIITRIKQQYDQQSNMTDIQAALQCLSNLTSPQTDSALAHFYDKYQDEPLVLDKWFSIQAASHREGVFETVQTLTAHPKFSYSNPNRVRSVIGVFCRQNILAFHRKDGAAYAWLAEQVLKLDEINPQVAARMLVPLMQWRRFDAKRQDLMRSELISLMANVQSKDVYELLEKSL